MNIAAPLQMKTVPDFRDLFAFLRQHGLAWTVRFKRSPHIADLQRSQPLLQPNSLFTLRSPGDQLQVVAFRLNQRRTPKEGIAND
jgi:hypothetical protein